MGLLWSYFWRVPEFPAESSRVFRGFVGNVAGSQTGRCGPSETAGGLHGIPQNPRFLPRFPERAREKSTEPNRKTGLPWPCFWRVPEFPAGFLFHLISFFLILFYFILFYSILRYFVLFYFILLYFILLYFTSFHLFPVFLRSKSKAEYLGETAAPRFCKVHFREGGRIPGGTSPISPKTPSLCRPKSAPQHPAILGSPGILGWPERSGSAEEESSRNVHRQPVILLL